MVLSAARPIAAIKAPHDTNQSSAAISVNRVRAFGPVRARRHHSGRSPNATSIRPIRVAGRRNIRKDSIPPAGTSLLTSAANAPAPAATGTLIITAGRRSIDIERS
jgi:hypothetical protein